MHASGRSTQDPDLPSTAVRERDSREPESPFEPSETTLLLEFLRERDYPCPICGGNLRNLSVGRCPHCGGELRTSFSTVHFPWLWGMLLVAGIASVASAGFVEANVALRRPLMLFTEPVVCFFWALTAWGFLILYCAKRGRQRFHRASHRVRVGLCVLAWFGVVADWLAILKWVR